MSAILGGKIQYTTAATGSNFSGAEAQTYTFATPVVGAYVANHPSSGITLYVSWNNTESGRTAATTQWDVVLAPGDVAFAPQTTFVKDVSIYSSGAGTLDTNYTVRGFA